MNSKLAATLIGLLAVGGTAVYLASSHTPVFVPAESTPPEVPGGGGPSLPPAVPPQTLPPSSGELRVTRVISSFAHKISADDLSEIEELFAGNTITMKNLQIIVFDKDPKLVHVRANQLSQGLPVFFDEIRYHFDLVGKLVSISGERFRSFSKSLEPAISKEDAAREARKKMERYSAFSAELGIYDANAGTKPANFGLAWRVLPGGQTDYPFAIIDAATGILLVYDDGIRRY